MNESQLTRRSVTAALTAASLPFGGASFASAAESSRPNILFLHCHDLGQHLHCYGVEGVQSPNLDRLAAEGVLFENNFCTAPQCSPSRASIFTGRYPHSNGVMGLTHADFAWDLNPDERHLGQILSDAGYACAGVGVIHETRSGAKRCGFADYMNASLAKEMADATIARLKEFAKNPDTPFYLQAGCVEPHRLPQPDANADQGFTGGRLQPDTSHGVTVPPYLRDTEGTRTELAELQGAVRHMDEQMGRVLAAVNESGLDKNTLVIFATDHGIAMPRAKCSLYEPGLRTSFMLRYPPRDGWHGGIRHKQMISNIDCLPTVLDAVGVPVPGNVHGRSLAPLMDGRSYTQRDRIFGEITYHDYYDPRRSVRTASHKLIVNFSSAPAFMDPSQSWRPRADTVAPPNHALAYHAPYEFYDLTRDPWERNDLSDVSRNPAYAAPLEDLRKQLAEHLQTTRDPILNGAVTPPLHRRSQAWLLS
jgi:arylsulfatase A-like enzyme